MAAVLPHMERSAVAAAEAAVAARDKGVRALEDSVLVQAKSHPMVSRQLGTCPVSSVTIVSSSVTFLGTVPNPRRARLAGAAPEVLAQPPSAPPPAKEMGAKAAKEKGVGARKGGKVVSLTLTRAKRGNV